MPTESNKSVATRFAIQPGQSVRLLNAPSNAAALIGRLPVGAQLASKGDGAADRVIFFTNTVKELDKLLPAAIDATAPDGALWVTYPKTDTKLSDVSRQSVHDKLRLAGWKPVAVMSLNEVWTAIRARPATTAERKKI
jgi:hypothetical protein